jgi:2-C-methyl-D-erythritol 4-phosphate cytidylyltransferase/2-C-methyl-D-erythritol 2,4-cyclodiphosphate synthase
MPFSIDSVKLHALIPSAGSGSRFGSELPKQFLLLNKKPMIEQTVDIFLGMTEIESIWVGLSQELMPLFEIKHPKLRSCLTGGDTRAKTVLNTLEYMLNESVSPNDWVLVHDAARPGITSEQIRTLIEAVFNSQACGGILALPVADTLKQTKPNQSSIIQTVSREQLWQAQTPQMFRIGELKEALEKCLTSKLMVTDEASAMEQIGLSPLLIKGSIENFKVTYPEDLQTMEKLFHQQPGIRIGQGYDVHRLVLGRDLILGGVKLEYDKGLEGHSDADALLHSITDALIGAAGLGDIGRHFPDTDPKLKNVDSAVLLKKTYDLIKNHGYQLVNIDSTIICQSPKLAKYIPLMISRIAEILEVEPQLINIKAKTNEGLGYLGASEAIETQAVALLC